MNDENFYQKGLTREEWDYPFPSDDHHRSGIRFARRVRLPRMAGLATMFFPIAGVLVTQPVAGGWWLLLVGWAFVWPHLAWQLASRSADPRSNEFYNLKADAIIAGIWIGLMGVNAFPTAALLMMTSMNMMGAGGLRLFTADDPCRPGDTADGQYSPPLCELSAAGVAHAAGVHFLPGALCAGQLPDRNPAGGTQATAGINEYPRRHDGRL